MRRRPILGALLTFGVLLGAGCAFDWSFPDEGGTPKEAGGPGDSPLGDVFIADSSSDRVDEDSGSVPTMTTCKLSSSECAPKQYCKFADRQCGTSQVGVCEPVPNVVCPQVDYVCGCSTAVYKSVCDAIKAGDDVSTTAACTAVAGTFRCGYRFCNTTKEFCLTTKDDAGGIPEYKCVAYAGTCGTTDCACTTIKNLFCSSCDQSKPGMVQVTCP